MKTIYRTSFRLKHDDPLDQTFDAVAATCLDWVCDPRRKLKVPGDLDRAKAASLQRIELGDGQTLEALRVRSGEDRPEAWGMRYAHPQQDNSGLLWTTEMGLLAADTASPTFSCSVSVSRLDDTLIPIRQQTSCPGIISKMLNRFDCVAVNRLFAKPIAVEPTEQDLSKFVAVLTSDTRTHPVVFVSARNDGKQTPLDLSQLAKQLAGLAHVLVARNAEVSWQLRDRLPAALLAYGGGVRVYWPGLKLSDPTYTHPLWTLGKIQSYPDPGRDLIWKLLRMIADAAIFNLHDNLLTWEALQSLFRAEAIEEARRLGKGAELLTLFEEENRSQSTAIKQLKEQLAVQSEEINRLKVANENLQASFTQLKADGTAPHYDSPAESVAEAVRRAGEQHENLVFAFNNKSEHEECPFMAPDEVEQALNWLATTFRDARTGKVACTDLNASVRTAIGGWSYSGGQSKASVGKFKEWYQCQWNGKDYWIGEHLRCGTSTKPEETIRIAFDWDKEAQKVIIGFIGQHQRNRNS